ncbi:MAG: lamin tail domain-containing protein [Nitrospirota bacterium]
MQRLKKSFILMTLVALALQFSMVRISAYAYSAGDVVINEIAWAGTDDNTGDEWIELYNSTNQAIDLAGWYIEDDGGASTYTISAGSIPAYGYFLIEDVEEATNVVADALVPLSLANAGDSLVLKDGGSVVIDTVNSSGGAWYAGTSTPKASMERIDPGGGDLAGNFATAMSSNGAVGRLGTEILGTPRSVNSNYDGGGPAVSVVAPATVNSGDDVVVSVEVDSVSDLYAYGFEINYDPAVLDFVSAVDSGLLGSDSEATAFNYGLENGVEGTLLVGNARLVNPPTGVDGAGALFELTFSVVGVDGDSTSLTLGGSSYLANSVGDILASFDGGNVDVGAGAGGVDGVVNLGVGPGASRYSLELSWSAGASGADSYIVMRQMVDGNYVVLGEVTELSYVDNYELLPGVTYNYQLIAVKNGVNSVVSGVSGMDDRGILGDLDRSDRVDGRDIEILARAYGSEYGDEEYDPLCDTTMDGIIDGSDLIDVGANFGITYP